MPVTREQVEAGRRFTRDEIVIRLIEQGVPRWKAEKVADEQVVAALAAPQQPKRKAKRTTHKVDLQARKFRVWCKDNDVPMPAPEFKFALPEREFRFDFAWVDEKVALEVNGGIFRKGGGAHQGKGHLRDMEKLNLAQTLGWDVLQVTPGELFNPLTLDLLRRALTQTEGV
jgi:hypothetical protein